MHMIYGIKLHLLNKYNINILYIGLVLHYIVLRLEK